jgi:hypothetical protein
VVRAVAQRYAVAAAAFLAAAVWLGVGVIHGFMCLFAFVFVAQAVRLYQRRTDSPARGHASSPSRHSARPRSTVEERDPAPRGTRSAKPPTSHGRIYDSDREEPAWQVSSEPAWWRECLRDRIGALSESLATLVATARSTLQRGAGQEAPAPGSSVAGRNWYAEDLLAPPTHSSCRENGEAQAGSQLQATRLPSLRSGTGLV